MNATTLVLVVIVAVAVIVGVAVMVRSRRSARLKSRFGPEYERAVAESGSRGRAEANLERIEKRVRSYHLTPLTPAARQEFSAAWRGVQARFVDDPRAALTEADQLIQKMMSTRGYPIADFEQRAADISVDHPLVVEHYRAGREISARHETGRASTEEMRQAMIHYRQLFADLSDEPELARAATAARA